MADSSRTIMTDAGFALETRVRADETKMQFTRAAISTDDHFSDTDDALAKLTELYNIQQDGKVTAVQVINTTTVYVQVDVNQAESKADYQMRSAALYAKDDDGTEVLYGVTVLQDPVFVHKDADGSYLGFGINTTVGKASNVVVVVDPANMVTQQVFEGTMKNYYTKAEVDAKFVTDDDFASKLPKNIATTDAANTFAKSQTLAGGATDGKGNAYATTKDVTTTLNNGLSTKVTDNHDNTITANNFTYDLSKTGLTPIGAIYGGSFNDLPLGTVFVSSSVKDGPDTLHAFTTTTFSFNGWSTGRKAQIAIADSTNLMYFRVYAAPSWKSWTLLSDDSKVVHTTDMRKSPSDVAGIEEVNAKQDKIGYTPADDSKVVHNSGNEEIGGQKTFDTAPVDKTTGNPYITKSDVATAVSAVNANMVHRNPDTGVVSEPVDFTNLTVNGGKSVATRDDLKSLETSAWRVLDNKCITAFTKYNTSIKVDENSLFLVKIDEVNKRVYMFFTILGNFVENSSIYIDLTSIVKNLSFPSYHLYYLEGNTASSTADGSIVGNRICFKIQIYDTTVLNSKYSSYMVNANDAGWIYSSCFVNYDELV